MYEPSPAAETAAPHHAGASARPVAARVLEALVEAGVDVVFGYPGGAVLPLYDALHGEPRLHHVLVRHEQAAVHAAEGYARVTGKVGVVFATSGPGMTNTVTGLLDAMSDSIPVLCLVGQVPRPLIGTQAFQECDALGISRPVTKWNARVNSPEEAVPLVRQALALAAGGRPGPVLVEIPKDVQQVLLGAPPPAAAHASAPPAAPAAGALQQAAALIAGASRPIFYGGGGLINAGPEACAAFTRLVQRTGAPCTLTLMGLGAFPGSDRQFLGMLGMHGTLEANLAMHDADLVVCVGARFDDRVTGRLDAFCPDARKIHIDIDPTNIGRLVAVDVALPGDCTVVLGALEQALDRVPGPPADLSAWWQRIDAWRAVDCLKPEIRDDLITPHHLLTALRDALDGRDAVVSTDVGQHQMWSAQFLRFERPRRWLTSGGAGTMGYGLPAAIGAQIAEPDALVVCLSGDASVLMNLQELSTAVQHGAAVKVIVLNNGSMGMVRQWQELHHGGRRSHSWTEALPDFVTVARGFGWQSARVSEPAALRSALDDCLASPGPCFLDVVVTRTANCFPMIAAGAAHHEVMLDEHTIYRPSAA